MLKFCEMKELKQFCAQVGTKFNTSLGTADVGAPAATPAAAAKRVRYNSDLIAILKNNILIHVSALSSKGVS